MITTSNLGRRDSLVIDHDSVAQFPKTYEVHDVNTKDIGLAEIVVVALMAGCDRYTLRQVGDNQPTLKSAEGTELELDMDDISTLDSAKDIEDVYGE
jgi:hypothetical protein